MYFSEMVASELESTYFFEFFSVLVMLRFDIELVGLAFDP